MENTSSEFVLCSLEDNNSTSLVGQDDSENRKLPGHLPFYGGDKERIKKNIFMSPSFFKNQRMDCLLPRNYRGTILTGRKDIIDANSWWYT